MPHVHELFPSWSNLPMATWQSAFPSLSRGVNHSRMDPIISSLFEKTLSIRYILANIRGSRRHTLQI